MEHQAYYRILNFEETHKLCNNVASGERPLIVNCTGLQKMTRPYVTNIPKGRNDFYLQYCIEGAIAVTVEGRTSTVSAGQVFIIPPYTPYNCKNLTEEVSYYWIHFTGSDAASLLERFHLQCNKVHTAGTGERIVRLFRALFREYLWRDRCFDDSAPACMITVLTEISRMRDSLAKENEVSVETLFRSLSYFHNRIQKPVTVAELAEIEHFSPSRYRTVFRKCMGMSPLEYMTHMRMRRACELLTTEDLSVAEVAEACGYQDPLYFSRVFRAHFNVAPSKYRASEDDSFGDTE